MSRLTMQDFSGCFTFRGAAELCGGYPETWKHYFLGEFDDEVSHAFEQALQPGQWEQAVTLRGFIMALEQRLCNTPEWKP